eukprot:TRINITY_DN2043_c0_g1_i8.p1 TRINITY_DN2043_c0_g1~~TRINITY_DN2043_c0_g1_i8.p1  ORF type:complete len:237 (-),score=39.45 TRINITY_DN2043_c0_g1_i8:16-726(-)
MQCDCREGFLSGENGLCEEPVCAGLCGDHGFCNTDLAVPRCDCDPFFYGEFCEENDSPCPARIVDGELLECSGNGECVNGSCVCDFFSGADCSVTDCALGDDDFQCSNHGKCLPENGTSWICDCFATWEGEVCNEAVCLVGENGKECSGKGICRFNGTANSCFCNEEYGGVVCSKVGDGSDDVSPFVWVALAIVILMILVVVIVVVAAISIAAFKVVRSKSAVSYTHLTLPTNREV